MTAGSGAGESQERGDSALEGRVETWDQDLARLLPPPLLSGCLRSTPDDFQVDEILGFEPDGAGNHWLLRVRKRGKNTSEIVELLAKSSVCKEQDVGYCGLKDRHAVTSQWFSVPIGRETDPLDPQSLAWPEGVELLEYARHGRKLRRGTHRGNRFQLVLRQISGEDPDWLARLDNLNRQGFPNYFSEQRFGRGGANLQLVERMGAVGTGRRWNRRDRNWGLSTLRALIFNRVLSERLYAGTAARVVAGDVLNLVGSRSWFVAEAAQRDELQDRLDRHDLAITGPLWGEEAPPSEGEVLKGELRVASEILEAFGEEGWSVLLKSWRAEQDRRMLMVVPEGLQSEQGPEALTIRFSLPRGSYATALIRELVQVDGAD